MAEQRIAVNIEKKGSKELVVVVDNDSDISYRDIEFLILHYDGSRYPMETFIGCMQFNQKYLHITNHFEKGFEFSFESEAQRDYWYNKFTASLSSK